MTRHYDIKERKGRECHMHPMNDIIGSHLPFCINLRKYRWSIKPLCAIYAMFSIAIISCHMLLLT
jgi:hypothetical protein